MDGDAGWRLLIDFVKMFFRIISWFLYHTVRLTFGGYELWRDSQPVKPTLFRLPFDARFAHTHICAGSGHGKTELIKHMIQTHDLELLAQKRASVIVIDSQGDLIKAISRLKLLSPDVPDGISDRVVIIDPTDTEHPPCLNLFDVGLDRVKQYSAVEQEQLLNGAIDLYEYMFGALLGAELTNRQSIVFRYLARLLEKIPGATIYTLLDFMEKPDTALPYVSKLDIATQRFFTTQLTSSSFDATRQQVAARLWGVLARPAIARMFTHSRNKLNMFAAMNAGSLILVNTAKGFLKEDSKLFGRFLIALISQATQERVSIPDEKRLPTFVYIDEAQDYFEEGAGIEDLLTQARKYRVGLILSNQHLGQLDKKLKDTVLTNSAVKLAGGLSEDDRNKFAKEMQTTPEFLQSLQKQPGLTRFALTVRNILPMAVELLVPLGKFSSLPRMTDAEYERLVALNQEKYTAPYDKTLIAQSEAVKQVATSFNLEDQAVL